MEVLLLAMQTKELSAQDSDTTPQSRHNADTLDAFTHSHILLQAS